ncbi:hypothetical protein [uncultured Acinetobacter sp.]|uniref:hypothetical protein n=1 Tax=uncultured Acinetobacter sp. TaxID=165433 RepID=UPI0034528E55
MAPKLGTPDSPRVAYFGMVPIPLGVHLGSLLGGLTPIEIYQHHRQHRLAIQSHDPKYPVG